MSSVPSNSPTDKRDTKMAPGQDVALARDMTFENIMHKRTATTDAGFSAMLKKDKIAQQAAVDHYFKHWDNKEAKDETEDIRAVSESTNPNVFPSSLTVRCEQLLR